MLASKYRFHGHAALKYVFSHGKTYRFKSMSIRVAENPRRQTSRAAVVISKKVIKASPKRNRVRRRVFEILRLHWDSIKPSRDIVLSVYDAAVLVMPHEELVDEIGHVLRQAQALEPVVGTKKEQ
jgi:ribonuclease P protein component